MENDPDQTDADGADAIGDETDDVDVDGDDLGEDDDIQDGGGGVEATKDIMDDDTVPADETTT
jgi:hypothetical protein